MGAVPPQVFPSVMSAPTMDWRSPNDLGAGEVVTQVCLRQYCLKAQRG